MVGTNDNPTQHRRWKTQAIIAVILAIVAVTAVVWYRAATAGYEIGRPRLLGLCPINLNSISKSMIVYANDDPNGRLPPADKWCDLLVQLDYTSLKSFVCFGSGECGK